MDFGIKPRYGERDPSKLGSLHLGHTIKIQDQSFKVSFPFPGADAPLFTEAGILVTLVFVPLLRTAPLCVN